MVAFRRAACGGRHQPDAKLMIIRRGEGGVERMGWPLWSPVPGTPGAPYTLVLHGRPFTSRDKGYAGGHKGPHTTPHRPRPYGTMIMLAINLPIRADRVPGYGRLSLTTPLWLDVGQHGSGVGRSYRRGIAAQPGAFDTTCGRMDLAQALRQLLGTQLNIETAL